MYKLSIFILAIISLSYKSLSSCKSKSDNSKIRAISVTYKMPMYYPDGSIIEFKDTYEVFYYEDIIMYRTFYRYDSLINGKPVLQEERPSYFVFHKDSLFGYSYYPKPDIALKDSRQPIDSIKEKTIQNFSYDSLFNHEPDSIYFDVEGSLVKVYNYSPSGKYIEKATYYFYYSKSLNGIKETFSKGIDTVRDMKLFKIRTIAHGAYYEDYKMSLPKRENLLEMKEVPVDNTELILGYFNRYKSKERKR